MSESASVRILHVDDNRNLVELAAEMLEREDSRFAVETATSASDGLDRLAANRFDCIVSDYQMPGQNGIEFLNTVRENYPDLPFILYTGKGSEEVASEAMSAGVTDYVQKRSGTDQYTLLANRIKNSVDRRQAQQQRRRSDRRFDAIFNDPGMLVSILSPDGTLRDANQTALEYIDADRDAVTGERFWMTPWWNEDVRSDVKQWITRAADGEYVDFEATHILADSDQRHVAGTVRPVTNNSGEVVSLVVSARDTTERKEREQAIESLDGTARAFIEATTAEDIAEIAVDATRDLLDLPTNAVYLYDEEQDQLVPTAWTDRVEDVIGEPPTFASGDGIAWQVFETGEAQIYDDVATCSQRYNPDTNVRSEIILPLSDHGVLIIGSDEPDAFSATDVDLGRTLAAQTTTALDRTAREQTLQEYKTLVETVGDPMFVLDDDGTIQMANDALLTYLNADKATVIGSSASEFITDGDFDQGTDLIENLLTNSDRRYNTYEITAVTTTGDQIPGEVNLAPLTDEDGLLEGAAGVVRDISARKQREQRLELERDRLESLFAAFPEPVVEVEFTDDGPLLRDVNEAFKTAFGYEAATVIGNNINDVIVPDDSAVRTEAEAIDKRADTGEQLTREVQRETSDGLRDFLFRSAPIKYEQDRENSRQFGLYIDITERKQRERALEQLQQRTQSLMNTATKKETARIAAEAAHDVLDIPLSGCHLLGDEQRRLNPTAVVDTVREEIGDPPAYERMADDDPAAEIVWQVFEDGDSLIIDDTHEYDRLAEVTPARSAIIHPLDDRGVFIASAVEPDAFDDTDMLLTEILATSIEAALERHDREQTLERQNDHLEELTNAMSHDLRNPLSVAQGRLDLVREECNSAHLDDIAWAHDRIEMLLDDLLELARHGNQIKELESVELAGSTNACWRTVSTVDATLVTETHQTILADPSRLKQLLENLFRNAVEHGGDDVNVTVGALDEGDGFYVADDGTGIPEDQRDAVFKTGYSTTDEGTGLGLSIVNEIAEAHGWGITVTDSETGGVRFEITGVEITAE